MNSMQEALTEALAHPITEMHPKRPQLMKQPRHDDERTSSGWLALGSLAASFLFFGVLIRKLTRPAAQAEPERYPPPPGLEALD